jgi:hypothetical protein
MGMRMLQAKPELAKALWLAMAAGQMCLIPVSAAQDGGGKAHDQPRPVLERSHPDKLPEKPTVPAAFSIPIEPLGFSPPGQIYLGQRSSLASLDFLGEDRLLFTFRVPGLIRREPRTGEEDPSEERHIKAVVLALPDGAVQAEAIWALHDRARYLWMLNDGHFLLRDRDELRLGDSSLELKPYLRFPGPVLAVEMDPEQQFLVTNSREMPSAASKPGEVPTPATAKADVAAHDDADKDQPGAHSAPPDVVLRILRRDSGKVMLVSRVRSPVHLSINSEGYLELLPGKGVDWVIALNTFGGGVKTLGQVDSSCSPSYDFLSQSEFLVHVCSRSEIRGLVAMSTDGRRLWEDAPSSSPVWPVMVAGADGSRVARESLAVSHPVTLYSPLSFEDVKGQLVEVFDAASGKIVLAAPVSPVLDTGGNVAISPSGKRVAVLNAGAIEVFDLPAPSPSLVGPAKAGESPAETGKPDVIKAAASKAGP